MPIIPGMKNTTPLVHHMLNAFIDWHAENEFDDIRVHVLVKLLDCPALTKNNPNETICINLGSKAIKGLLITEDGVSCTGWHVANHPLAIAFPLTALAFIELPMNDGTAIAYAFGDLSWIGFKEVDLVDADASLQGPDYKHRKNPDDETVMKIRAEVEQAKAQNVPHLRPVK